MIQELNGDLARLNLAPHIGAYSSSSKHSATLDRRGCGIELATVETELVDANDYWNFNQFSWPRSLNSFGINVLGDRVTRCFLARLELRVDALRGCFNDTHCQNAPFGTEAEQISNVKSSLTEVRKYCLGRLNGFDEACVILTQTYVAFARLADPYWMKNSLVSAKPPRDPTAKTLLDPVVDLDAIDRVIWALTTVSRSLQELPDPEVVVLNAAACFDLVVDLSAKKFFWKGEKFLPQLSPVSWELFSVLVEAHRRWNRADLTKGL